MMMMVLLSAIWLTYERVAGLPMKRSDDGARRFWITKAGPIREELLDVQAIIVKDEEVPAGAEQCKSRNADARYSWERDTRIYYILFFFRFGCWEAALFGRDIPLCIAREFFKYFFNGNIGFDLVNHVMTDFLKIVRFFPRWDHRYIN